VTLKHVTVLLREAVDALAPAPGRRFLDVTAGGGGHTAALLAAGGRVLATDADADAVARVRQRLASDVAAGTLRVEQAWLDDALAVAERCGMTPLDGVLADLGLSSFQLDEAERGFAFMRDGPLDMRFDRTRGHSAADWLEYNDPAEIARVLREYGDVQNARRIAEAIWAARPIRTTGQLRELVGAAAAVRSGRIHPATLVFQALRIAVNDELRRLADALPPLIGALRPGGRIAVIAFHSLEDRIVKNAFRDLSRTVLPEPGFGDMRAQHAQLRILTREPITPTDDEIAANPRARSARLRVAERLAPVDDVVSPNPSND
jgi:16S rRNA (cytosine1402-N4)-methyltransferase